MKNVKFIVFLAFTVFSNIFFVKLLAQENVNCDIPESFNDDIFNNSQGDCFDSPIIFTAREFDYLPINDEILGIDASEITTTTMDDDAKNNLDKIMTAGFGDKSFEEILECLDFFCSPFASQLNNEYGDIMQIIQAGLSEEDINDLDTSGLPEEYEDPSVVIDMIGDAMSNINLNDELSEILNIPIGDCENSLFSQLISSSFIDDETSGQKNLKNRLENHFQELIERSLLNGGGGEGDPNWFLEDIQGLGATNNQISQPQNINDQVQSSVNLYNGSASFNYNLTSIGSKDINIPISVQSSPGGIRVNDQESTIGTGNSLANLGSITRKINGLPDDFNGIIAGKSYGYKRGIKFVTELYDTHLGFEPLEPINEIMEKYLCKLIKKILEAAVLNKASVQSDLPNIQPIITDIVSRTPDKLQQQLYSLIQNLPIEEIEELLKIKYLYESNETLYDFKIYFNPLQPNYVNAVATYKIPLGNLPITLNIGIGARVGIKIVDIPSPVNLEKEVLGYNYLNSSEMENFDLEPTNVSNIAKIHCANSANLKDSGIKYLLSNQESNKRTDKEFFGSKLYGFFHFFKDIKEVFNIKGDEVEPRYKTKKIDLEPDEYHYSFGKYSGKFVLNFQNLGSSNFDGKVEVDLLCGKDIIYIPYQDFETTVMFEDQKIIGFKIRTPEGIDYLLDMPEIHEDNYYDLPMFLEYPESQNSRTEFLSPQLASAEFPTYTWFMGIPMMVDIKKDYLTNYFIEHKPSSINAWYVTKIESNLTKEKITLEYETRNTTLHLNKNFSFTYPNFDINKGEFSTKLNNSLDYYDSDTRWNNGFSELHYQVTESNVLKPVIKNISNNRGTKIEFTYQTNENKAKVGDYLLDKITLKKNNEFFKAWQFSYNTPSYSAVQFMCDTHLGEDASLLGNNAFNSASGETIFNFDIGTGTKSRRFLFYFPFTFNIWCFNYTFPIKIPFNMWSTKYPKYFSNQLSEYGSLIDLKQTLNIIDDNEAKRFQAESVRNYLTSINELGLQGETYPDIISLSYKGDLSLIPKRFSLQQDVWGYYLKKTYQYPFIDMGYTDLFGNKVQDSKDHFGFSLNSSNSETSRSFEASLEESSLGQIDSIKFETGAFIHYLYDLHEYPYIKHINDNIPLKSLKGGLRLSFLHKGSNTGNTQIIEYSYQEPTIINFPYFQIEESNSVYFELLETKITTSFSPLTNWNMNKNGYVGYKSVVENFPDNGYVVHSFTNPEMYRPIHFNPNKFSIKYRRVLDFGLFDKENATIEDVESLGHRIQYEPKNWKLGLSKNVKYFDDNDDLLKSTEINYSFHPMKRCNYFSYPSSKMYQTNHYGTLLDRVLTGLFYGVVDNLTQINNTIVDMYVSYLFNLFKPVHPYKYIKKDFIVNFREVYSEVVHIDQQKTTEYFDIGVSSSETSNTYDGVNIDKLSETNVIFSDQNHVSTKYYYPYDSDFDGFEPATLNALQSIHYRQPIHVEKILNGEKYEVNINDYDLIGDKFLIKRSWAQIGDEIRLTGKFDDFDEDLGMANSYYKAQYGTGTDEVNYSFLPKMSFTWNPQMQLTSRTFEAKTTSYNYDTLGRLKHETDVNGLTQHYEYDNRHRVYKTRNHDDSQITTKEYIMNPPEVISTIIFKDGTPSQTTVTKTDGWGNELLEARENGGSQTILSSNSYDNMFRVTDAYHYQNGNVQYIFDESPINRLRSTIDANGNTFSMNYFGQSAEGYTGVKTMDPNGNSSITYKNSLDNVSYTKSGEGNETSYTYDNKNRIKFIKNAIGETYSYQYNTHTGMLASKSIPNSGSEKYWYDKNYQLVATKNGNGYQKTMDYDIYGRILSISNSNANLTNSISIEPYDVDFINDFNIYNLTENTYMPDKMWVDHAVNNIIKNNQISGSVFSDISYDNIGRITMTNSNYAVDGVTSNKISTLAYNDAGLVERNFSQLTHNNTTYTIANRYTFDDLLRLKFTDLIYDGDSTTVEELIYFSNDLIEKKYVGGNSAEGLQEVNYSYDATGRLVSINDPATTNCFEKVQLCHFLFASNEFSFQKTIFSGVTIDGVHYECPEDVTGTVYNNAIIFETWVNQLLQDHGYLGSFSFHLQHLYELFPDQLEMSLNLSDVESFIVHINMGSITDFVLDKKDCCDRIIMNPNKKHTMGDLFFEHLGYDGLDINNITLGVNCNFGLLENFYVYDKDHRITSMSSHLTQEQFYPNAFNTNYQYDEVGNILGLERKGYIDSLDEFRIIDSLLYIYDDGNSQVTEIQDLVSENIERKVGFGQESEISNYTYDGMGNMIANGNSGVVNSIFNIVNMPETIQLQSGDVHYYYSSDQRKLMSQKQTVQGLKTHRYFDEFELRNDTLYAIQIPNGRISPKGDDYSLQYFLKDHLGNIVVTFEDSNGDGEIEENGGQSEVLQRNVYYPFGMEIIHPALEDLSETTQDLKYNGKESQEDFNLNYLDYHARQYDAVIGRFVGVDPLAADMPAWSPYNYVFNNPINLIDPLGLSPESPDWIYDQQEDGSYTRREGVENDGGENFHTFNSNDGTVTYVNTKEGTCATVCMDDVNQKVEDLNTPVVHQLGLTAAGGAPLGLTISGGIAWDSEGNVNPYGSAEFFHGLDITVGIEYTQSRSNSNDKNFSIYSLDGTSVNYNAGAYIFDAAYGGDTQGNGNYGQNKQATYSSYTGGVSVGIPVGLNRSVESTKIFKLFGQ